MNCSKNCIDICEKEIWLPNKEYLRGYRCKGHHMNNIYNSDEISDVQIEYT